MPRCSIALLTLGLAVVFGVLSCSSDAAKPAFEAASVKSSRPSIGTVMHRGRMYDLQDLLDADYRAASDDEFVRDFNPDTAYAETIWAGHEPGFKSDSPSVEYE